MPTTSWHERRLAPRVINSNGYVEVSIARMSPDEIALADEHNLWVGRDRGRRARAKEHQLVAAKKYGRLPEGMLVRHLNGDKTDNRPENLVIGTSKDNSMDHHTAVRQMMYWRERALRAEGKDIIDEIE